MKKFKILIALFLLGLASVVANAQYRTYSNYGYKYSGYTVGHGTYMPHSVKKVVGTYHRHYGFNWVGTSEFQRGYKKFYLVTLRKGNRFLELTINRRGKIIKRKKYAIQFRDRRPRRRIYTNNKEIYHHDGYVYSRREERRRYDYPWDHDWKD